MAHSSLYQQNPTPSRGARFFKIKEHWYYKTSEGLTIGPFQTKVDAAKSLHEYVTVINGAAPEDMPLAPLRRFFEPSDVLQAG